MKKQDLESKIKSAFESEKPDLISKIKETCENTNQVPIQPKILPKRKNITKRILIYAACVAVLALFIVGGYQISKDDYIQPEISVSDNSIWDNTSQIVSTEETNEIVSKSDVSTPETILPETCVYIDVNPSVKLQLDNENNVISCTPDNNDAENVVNGLELEGKTVDQALTEIMNSMRHHGYLSAQSNSVLVSVDTQNTENAEEFLNHITEKINDAFDDTEMECSIIAQQVKADEDLKQRAKENGISVGKMHLVDKMVENIDGFNKEHIPQLTHMPIKDLNLIYATHPPKDGEKPFDKDIVMGDIGGFIPKEEVLETLINATEIEENDIEFYDIKAKPIKNGEENQMVYMVLIKLFEDAEKYEFEVDCETGEVLKLDSKLPPKDMPKPPQENGEQDFEGYPEINDGKFPPKEEIPSENELGKGFPEGQIIPE